MIDVGVYQTNKYIAYIYIDSIVICTNLQCFRVRSDRYSEYYIDQLKLDILNGKVTTLSDLKDYGGKLKWNNCYKPQ